MMEFITKESHHPLGNLLNSQNIPELNSNFANLCQHYMLGNFSIALPNQNEFEASDDFSVLDTYPAAWREHYIAQKYYEIDPVFQKGSNIRTPFCWHVDGFNALSNAQSIMMKEAHDYNIKSGTTIPIFTTGNNPAFITFLDCYISHPELLYIILNGSYIFLMLKNKIKANCRIDVLTVKEKEVLSLKAKGHAIKRVADIMGISDATVIFHLKNIRSKLHVKNTEQALYLYGRAHGII